MGNHFSRQTHVGHSFFTRKQNRSPRWSLLMFITLEAKLQMGDSGGHGETDSVSAPLTASPRVSRELVFLPPNNAFRLDASPRERWAKFKAQSSFYRHLPCLCRPSHPTSKIQSGLVCNFFRRTGISKQTGSTLQQWKKQGWCVCTGRRWGEGVGGVGVGVHSTQLSLTF